MKLKDKEEGCLNKVKKGWSELDLIRKKNKEGEQHLIPSLFFFFFVPSS